MDGDEALIERSLRNEILRNEFLILEMTSFLTN